jgi:uncharacterized protein
MTQTIARHIEPSQLARRGASLSGLLAAERCGRIEGLSGPVTVELGFSADADGHPVATGVLAAEVRVVCERCLAPFVLQLEPQVHWRFVDAGSSSSEETECDDIEFEGGEVDLVTLVEDELLLEMPAFPRHAEACTGGDIPTALEEVDAVAVEEPAPQTQRPFAGLAELLGRKPGPDGSQEEH